MAEQGSGWRYEHEVLRRTIAALEPGAPALNREEALTLLDQFTETRKNLDDLQAAIEKARRAREQRLGLGDDEAPPE